MKVLRVLGWSICFFILFLLACGTDERDKIRSQYGPPEEVQKYDAQNYHTETWWYWCRGISFTFKEEPRGIFCGGGSDWKKDSTYSFSPICGISELKNQEKTNLIERLKFGW